MAAFESEHRPDQLGARVLVTGGAGFIGSHVVDDLVQAGFDVHVLDNFTTGRREHLADLPNEQIHVADLRDSGRVAEVVATLRPERVYHMAAIHFIPYCNEHPTEAVLINVLGTRNLLHALGAVPPKALFFASTAAVYAPNVRAHLESEPAAPSDVYGASKVAGEALVEAFAAATDTPCTIGRLFNAIGHRETNPHLVPEIVRQLGGGVRTISLGNLEPARDFIDARDLAAGIVAATQSVRTGTETFNIGAGQEYTVLEVVRACEKILGETVEIIRDPARVRKVERPNLLAGIEKLSQATGWRPRIGLQQSLAELLDPLVAGRSDPVSWPGRNGEVAAGSRAASDVTK